MMCLKILFQLLKYQREASKGRFSLNGRILDKLKNEELLSIVLLINDDLQKTFSRYTDLSTNRMPEEYTSIFEPEKPPEPKKPFVRRPPPPPESRPEPEPVPAEYMAPREPQGEPPAPHPPPMPTPVQQPVTYFMEQPVATTPPVAPETVFNLFDAPEEKKVEEPIESILMNPLMPSGGRVPPPAPVAPPQEDTTSKLNNILKRMQQNDEEEGRRKEEEARRIEAMKAQQAQYATGFGMNPVMNPMMFMTGNMGPYIRPNPYMTGYPGMGMNMGMQRPQGTGSLPYQILKPIVKNEPKKQPEPEPEVRDEFTDLFDLAKVSLSAKPQGQRKATPFDEEFFPSSATNEIYRQKINFSRPAPSGDRATELFGNLRQPPENQFAGTPSYNVDYNPAPSNAKYNAAGYTSQIVNPPGMTNPQGVTGTVANSDDIFDLF